MKIDETKTTEQLIKEKEERQKQLYQLDTVGFNRRHFELFKRLQSNIAKLENAIERRREVE